MNTDTTDEPPRVTTPETRFEIGYDDELLDTAPTQRGAFRCAAFHAMKLGREVGVFDRMARRHQPCRWVFDARGECREE